MRIGTWNLAGRWDARHLDLIQAINCDVLLLTEVPERVDVLGYDVQFGRRLMMPKAAVGGDRFPAGHVS